MNNWFRGLRFSLILTVAALLLASADSVPAQGTASLSAMLRAVNGTRGICVHLGCGEGELSARLAAGGKLLVHALESNPHNVSVAREALQQRGIYGVVSVEQWTAAQLPYPDNVINVLVAENPGKISEAELKRVLVPNGTAWIRHGNDWTELHKLWPAAFDEWTHWRHGADGNMVSRDLAVGVPKGLRWVAGPAQDPYGKKWYYDHVLVSANGRNFYTYENEMTARDAFNGSLLWKRKIKAYSFRETGVPVPSFLQAKAKLGSRTSKVRPVAVGDRVYVAAEGKLMALDAATGQTASELGAVTKPRELLVEGNTLVVSDQDVVRAYYLPSQSLKWEVPITAERIVAGDGSLFCLASNVVASFDVETGQERWRTLDEQAIPASTVTYGQGCLVLEKSTWRNDPEGCGVLVYSGKDGQLLWHRDYRTDQTHYQEARGFFAQDLLWLQMGKNTIAGLDPRTGQQQQEWGSRGKHCATPVATERFFIAPECEFTDLSSGIQEQARMFKSACRLPFIPANGLLNTFPVQCECFPMLRGYMGLSPTLTPTVTEGPRLKKGPAFGQSAARQSGPGPADEWPMYRHDPFRSGSTSMKLASASWQPKWTAQVTLTKSNALEGEWRDNPFVRSPVTPPVVAGNRVIVAAPDEHRVVALDAQSGKPLWSFTAGGRIDTPPTLADGLCLFGAHDGNVYCLNAANGELAWQFRAAPGEARIPAYGQMESPWPVPGSVLVADGIAYFAAGRHPRSETGIYVGALKTGSGELIWQTNINQLDLKGWYGMLLPTTNSALRQKVGLDFECIDMLVKDGPLVAMSRWQFNPLNGDCHLALGSLDYAAPGLAVPRGLWGYGIRQTKAVDYQAAGSF